MKSHYLSPFFCSAILLLGSCQGPETAEPPRAPAPEIIAALKEQPFGSKLLGRTSYLVGRKYIRSDLQKAPRYYIINFSASW